MLFFAIMLGGGRDDHIVIQRGSVSGLGAAIGRWSMHRGEKGRHAS